MRKLNYSAYSSGFPVALYESIQRRMGPHQPKHPDLYRHLAGGWNGLQNRSIGCERCSKEYTALFTRFGVAPAQHVRVAQDNALYGFFAYALSAIESWLFAMHAAAAMDQAAAFPMATDGELKAVTPSIVSGRFRSTYAGSSISVVIEKLLSEPTYVEWRDLRNVLVHRAAPGRHFFQPPRATPRDADWIDMGIALDKETLSGRYPWLMSTVDALVQASEEFTAQMF
jgi:hypothetical protein